MSRVPTTGCSRASLQWLSTSVASSISSATPRAPRSNQCQAGQARLSTELAHRRLFERPLVEPNMYIIRMYDLSKWEEAAATRVPVAIDANSVIHVHGASTFQVPVKVDERLVLQRRRASRATPMSTRAIVSTRARPRRAALDAPPLTRRPRGHVCRWHDRDTHRGQAGWHSGGDPEADHTKSAPHS